MQNELTEKEEAAKIYGEFFQVLWEHNKAKQCAVLSVVHTMNTVADGSLLWDRLNRIKKHIDEIKP